MLSKRIFDVCLSGIGILVSLPLWLLIAIAIKLEDGGPVFYYQERVGKEGKVFKVYKFRSMIPDAEKYTGAVWASEHDPRVTRVGRILRATAMDELPQLWSIFKGDMSFVGPRPERPLPWICSLSSSLFLLPLWANGRTGENLESSGGGEEC